MCRKRVEHLAYQRGLKAESIDTGTDGPQGLHYETQLRGEGAFRTQSHEHQEVLPSCSEEVSETASQNGPIADEHYKLEAADV